MKLDESGIVRLFQQQCIRCTGGQKKKVNGNLGKKFCHNPRAFLAEETANWKTLRWDVPSFQQQQGGYFDWKWEGDAGEVWEEIVLWVLCGASIVQQG